MKKVIKFLCNFALCFVAIDAWGVTIQDGVLSVQAGETYDIDSESFLSIFNFGTVTGNMTVSGGAQVIIQNYGTMSLLCNNSSSCVGVNQVITGNGDINLHALQVHTFFHHLIPNAVDGLGASLDFIFQTSLV